MFKSIFKLATFILSPPYCEGCYTILRDRFIFCSDCYADIKPITTISLPIKEGVSVKVFSISNYEYPLKKLILAKRISNRLSSEYLATLMWQLTAIKYAEFDYIVSVPLHWVRRVKRGYNQTEVMAEELSKLSGKPILKVLTRSKRTRFQSDLNLDEREANVKNCFDVADNFLVKGKKVLLVDDLMTSGATIKYASKQLLKSGVDSIVVAVGCRVV
jgi:competence protein ComFC